MAHLAESLTRRYQVLRPHLSELQPSGVVPRGAAWWRTSPADTWRKVRHELDRMHLVTLATPDGRVAQRSAVTAGQKTILAALGLPEPPRFFPCPRSCRSTPIFI